MAFTTEKDLSTHPVTLYLLGDEGSRPPNWRWEAAKWLAKNPKKIRKFSVDSWTNVAIRFHRELMTVKEPDDQIKLWRRFPGIYDAHRCYTSYDKNKRWIIEAYLCADAAFTDIAKIVGMKTETVGFFAKLFYDVAGKTENWGYIFTEALGKPLSARMSENDVDVLWKIYGLLKGPHMLSMLIKHDTSPGRSSSVSAAAAALQDLVAGAVQVKTLIAARTMNPLVQPIELINAHSKLREVEIEATASSGAGGLAGRSIQAGLSAVLATLKFAIGGVDALSTDEFKKHKESLIASEPRAAERLRLAFMEEDADYEVKSQRDSSRS